MLSRWRLGLVCGMLVAGSAIAVWATGSPFPDVPEDHPQASDISRAKAEGWFLARLMAPSALANHLPNGRLQLF